MKKIISSVIALSTLAVASAQSGNLNLPQIPPSANQNNSSSIGQSLINIVLQFKQISTLVYSSLFVVALILFFVGIFRFMLSKEAKAHEDGLKYMGFGVLALFVMVAVWGIVAFISQTLGIGIGGDIMVPRVPTSVQTY